MSPPEHLATELELTRRAVERLARLVAALSPFALTQARQEVAAIIADLRPVPEGQIGEGGLFVFDGHGPDHKE
jgi:hypothetical protein